MSDEPTPEDQNFEGELWDKSAGHTGEARRNKVAANWFTISRSIWNMHDALLTEQRRTNQLLEWVGQLLSYQIEHGTAPAPPAAVPPAAEGNPE